MLCPRRIVIVPEPWLVCSAVNETECSDGFVLRPQLEESREERRHGGVLEVDGTQAEQPRVLIVSPVRNEAAHIARVARAVAAQELPPARWIVIDDGSTDGTLERLRELEREVPS